MQKCLHKCETLLGFSIKTKWRWFIEFPRGYLIEQPHRYFKFLTFGNILRFPLLIFIDVSVGEKFV